MTRRERVIAQAQLEMAMYVRTRAAGLNAGDDVPMKDVEGLLKVLTGLAEMCCLAPKERVKYDKGTSGGGVAVKMNDGWEAYSE